jgi:hypothetical protein
LSLFDGTEEPFDPTSLMTGHGDALYVRVKGGRYDAKLLPQAQAALVELLVEGEDGVPMVELGGKRFPIGRREEPNRA